MAKRFKVAADESSAIIFISLNSDSADPSLQDFDQKSALVNFLRRRIRAGEKITLCRVLLIDDFANLVNLRLSFYPVF